MTHGEKNDFSCKYLESGIWLVPYLPIEYISEPLIFWCFLVFDFYRCWSWCLFICFLINSEAYASYVFWKYFSLKNTISFCITKNCIRLQLINPFQAVFALLCLLKTSENYLKCLVEGLVRTRALDASCMQLVLNKAALAVNNKNAIMNWI